MKTGIYYGIVASTKTQVRCVFCGVSIPKANKSIEEHNNGAKHHENMELISENGISYTFNQGVYCKLCERNVAEDESIAQHIETEDHANWLAALDDLIDGEFIRVDGFLAGRSDDVYCEPCQVAIPCTLQNIEQHVNHEDHHGNLADSVKPLNALFPVEGHQELWCKICDFYIENSVPAVMDHIETDEHHTDWFMKMEPYIEDNGIFVGNYLAHEFENKVYCLRCKAEILCNLQSIEYHVQTEAHMNSELPDTSEISELDTQSQ